MGKGKGREENIYGMGGRNIASWPFGRENVGNPFCAPSLDGIDRFGWMDGWMPSRNSWKGKMGKMGGMKGQT